jgi:hypothetical protein
MGLSYDADIANRTSPATHPSNLLHVSNDTGSGNIQVAGVQNGDPDFIRR